MARSHSKWSSRLLIVAAALMCVAPMALASVELQQPVFGGANGVALVDAPVATASGPIAADDEIIVATIGGSARKLLQQVTKYIIKGGGAKGGAISCGFGTQLPRICNATQDTARATRFVFFVGRERSNTSNTYYQIQQFNTSYCLTLYSAGKQVYVYLDKCTKPATKAPSFQLFAYISYTANGKTSLRSGGPRITDYAMWYSASGKPIEARKGCNSDQNAACEFSIVKA